MANLSLPQFLSLMRSTKQGASITFALTSLTRWTALLPLLFSWTATSLWTFLLAWSSRLSSKTSSSPASDRHNKSQFLWNIYSFCLQPRGCSWLGFSTESCCYCNQLLAADISTLGPSYLETLPHLGTFVTHFWSLTFREVFSDLPQIGWLL